MNKKNLVVHCMKDDYDVYIGRGKCPKTGKIGKWGNPFIIGKDGTREEVIAKYRNWILNNEKLLKNINELRNKTLGCWCRPKVCHGDVLLDILSGSSMK